MPQETIPAHTTPDPVKTPPPAATPEVGAKKSFSEFIPEDFRSKPYLKEIAAMEDGPEARVALFKKLDGAETLVGKKSGVPAADAPAEEWEKFGTALRPEKPEDYEIVVPEGDKEDPVFSKMVRDSFHKAGIHKSQARKFQDALVPALREAQKAQVEAGKAAAIEQDKKFDAEVTTMFGAEKDKALAKAKAMLDTATATVPAARERLGKLDNDAVLVVAALYHAIHSKYESEDRGADGGGKSSTPQDGVSLRDEVNKLVATPAYSNEWDPKHEEVRAKVRSLCEKIAATKKA